MQTIRTNLTNTASTQYTNFDFTSMCLFNGVKLGAGPGGLSKICCGKTDNGVEINGYITLMTSDLGYRAEKRMRFIYAGFSSDGPVAVSVNFDGAKVSDDLAFDHDISKTRQTDKVVVPRTLGWFHHAAVTFKAIDGSSFSLNHIETELFRRGYGVA